MRSTLLVAHVTLLVVPSSGCGHEEQEGAARTEGASRSAPHEGYKNKRGGCREMALAGWRGAETAQGQREHTGRAHADKMPPPPPPPGRSLLLLPLLLLLLPGRLPRCSEGIPPEAQRLLPSWRTAAGPR